MSQNVNLTDKSIEIIDQYKELNKKVDNVLEKIAKKKQRKSTPKT